MKRQRWGTIFRVVIYLWGEDGRDERGVKLTTVHSRRAKRVYVRVSPSLSTHARRAMNATDAARHQKLTGQLTLFFFFLSKEKGKRTDTDDH